MIGLIFAIEIQIQLSHCRHSSVAASGITTGSSVFTLPNDSLHASREELRDRSYIGLTSEPFNHSLSNPLYPCRQLPVGTSRVTNWWARLILRHVAAWTHSPLIRYLQRPHRRLSHLHLHCAKLGRVPLVGGHVERDPIAALHALAVEFGDVEKDVRSASVSPDESRL